MNHQLYAHLLVYDQIFGRILAGESEQFVNAKALQVEHTIHYIFFCIQEMQVFFMLVYSEVADLIQSRVCIFDKYHIIKKITDLFNRN
jgi:hypothetical protein